MGRESSEAVIESAARYASSKITIPAA